ncbi:MAG: hypothetical protein OXK79_13190 [Chloroflexota bacterium]|nr:hypothetical protein [Chloroflexota bacterium]
MNKDDNRRSKMEVLYRIEETRLEIAGISRELLRAARTFQQLGESLPEYADVRQAQIPAKPRTKGLPEPDCVREQIDRLDSMRRKMQKLERHRARLYSGRV